MTSKTFTDPDLQEKVDAFLNSAPYWIQEGTEEEMCAYLLLQSPIQHRIMPVEAATLMPFVDAWILDQADASAKAFFSQLTK